jgi:hypothetical protein
MVWRALCAPKDYLRELVSRTAARRMHELLGTPLFDGYSTGDVQRLFDVLNFVL